MAHSEESWPSPACWTGTGRLQVHLGQLLYLRRKKSRLEAKWPALLRAFAPTFEIQKEKPRFVRRSAAEARRVAGFLGSPPPISAPPWTGAGNLQQVVCYLGVRMWKDGGVTLGDYYFKFLDCLPLLVLGHGPWFLL